MAGGSREVRLIKSGLMAAALIGAMALPAKAAELALSATTVFTTDYMFRSISNTSQNPAVQPEFDLTYGIFYAGIWGSNTSFGEGVELDYYAGITPKWNNITFNFGALAYTYPSANDIDYWEAKAGATWTGGNWTLGVTNYYAPDFAAAFGNSDAIEGGVAYAFTNKIFNFFSPTISALVGFQSYEHIASDYVYWNAGLTLGFAEHWSVDIRYYDTDYNQNQCFVNSGGRDNCDSRAVGTVKAVF
jgi:uncharacterized protein (TIGR02001 family)